MKALRYVIQSALLIAIVMFFQSCYESAYPLTASGEAVPKNLIGTWYETKNLNDAKDKRKNFEITKGKKNTLIIKKQEYNTTEKTWDVTWYKGHLSKVKEALFLNWQEVSEEDLENDNVDGAMYRFFKLNNEGSLLRLSSVTGNISEEFEDSKSLYDFFSKSYDKSFFYDKSEELVLIKKETIEK